MKKVFRIIVQELISHGIGWVAGLLSANMLSYFFVARKWWNLGGALSKKAALDANTLNILEWFVTAVIGFVVMVLVNKYVAPPILKLLQDKE